MLKYLCFVLLVLVFISCIQTPRMRYRTKILNMIDSIEYKPINSNTNYIVYIRKLMDYSIDPGVFLILDPILTPWLADSIHDRAMDMKWRRALLSSYWAGCIVHNDTTDSPVDRAYIGNLFVLRTYNKIKEIDTSVYVPFLDSLNDDKFKIIFSERSERFMMGYIKKILDREYINKYGSVSDSLEEIK